MRSLRLTGWLPPVLLVFIWSACDGGGTDPLPPPPPPLPPPPSSVAPWTAIGGGEAYTCALDSTSQVWCWGRRSAAAKVSFSPDFKPVTLAFGGFHVCGLDLLGDVWCWGDGSVGQLGHGQRANSETPVKVHGGVRFVSLDAGRTHTCGITSDSLAYCWGLNEDGQLGSGESGFDQVATAPRAVATPLRFASITAGVFHSCAITGDGAAYCWGRNGRHLGNTEDLVVEPRVQPTPSPVLGGLTFGLVDAGYYHTCGLSGTDAYCWGENFDGVLGAQPANSIPTRITNLPALVSLHVGAMLGKASFVCGRAADGRAYCWGSNRYGQLGAGSLEEHLPPGTSIVSGVPVAALGAGAEHMCSIDLTGIAWCWGMDLDRQLGSSTARDTCQPSFPVPCSRTPTKVDAAPAVRNAS